MISFKSRTDAVAEISSSTTGFAPGASCSFKSMQVCENFNFKKFVRCRSTCFINRLDSLADIDLFEIPTIWQ